MSARAAKLTAAALAVGLALYAAAGFLLLPWLAQRYLPSTLAERLDRPVRVDEFLANPFLFTLEVKGVTIEDDHGQAMLSIRRVVANASLRGLVRGTWTLDELVVEGLQAHVVREADGSVNVVKAAQGWRQPETQKGASPGISIQQLSMPDARIDITAMDDTNDADDTGVARATLGPIQFRASNLSTVQGAPPLSYALDAALPEGGSLAVQGELTVGPALAAHGQFSLLQLKATPWLPFVKRTLPLADLKGTVDLTGRYALGPDKSLEVTDMHLDATGVSVTRRGETAPLLAVQQIAAQAASLGLGQRAVQVGQLLLKKGQVRIVTSPTSPAGAERHGTASAPWTLKVPALRLEQMGLSYGAVSDQPAEAAPALAVGQINGRTALAVTLGGRDRQVVLSGLQATLADAALRGANKGEMAVSIASAEVQDGRFDLAARQLGAANIVATGRADLVRSRSGQLLWPALFAGREPAESAAQPWRYAIDALEVPSLVLALVDHGLTPALQLQATLSARARPLVTGKPASFDATLSFADGASVTAVGTAAVNPVQVRAQVEARSMALRPFQPVLTPLATLSMASGLVSGSAQLRFDGAQAALRLDGQLDISDLRLNEAGTTQRFLAWRQLQAQGATLDFRADRRHVTVRDISVRQAEAKIVISQNRAVNVVQVFQRDRGSPDVRASRQASAPALSFDIDQVRLQDSDIDFSDLSLLLPFSTKVQGLSGTIVDVSSNPERRAAVKASGQIAPYGSASVAGGIIAAAPTRFMRLDVQFNNVWVPPLSPYTATFAGRKVEAGQLWLDLEYRVENGELLGKNDIRLQNFKLGERVQAAGALDVPLDLVVAMLSDGDGNIRLSVPVTGELGNPRFSVASAVGQAVANVLQRVVTAPFRALASLFGGNPESLGAIDFAPGSAKLRPQELEKLDALTRALRERPQLALVVAAPHDPELDAVALRQAQAQRALTQALGRRTDADGEPGPVSFDDPATRRVIQAMLQSVGGDNAVSNMVQAFGDRPGLFEAMLDRVAAAQELPDKATELLAMERARQIASYLLAQGIDRSRLETGQITSERSKIDEVSSRLQVGAASQGAAPADRPTPD